MPVYDKLKIVNSALIATGNEPVTTDDGSSEWLASSEAYDRALPLMLYKSGWTFQTKTNVALARIGTSAYPGYSDIYQKPVDCLHIENVWRTDLAALAVPSSSFDLYGMGTMPPPLDYKIIGDQIHCYAPSGASCLYVAIPDPYGQSGEWPPGFAEALIRQVESYLYQSLNEDSGSAVATGRAAGAELAEARSAVDSEQPRKVAFRSRFLERRRIPRGG